MMDFLLDMKTIILSLGVGHLFTVILISAYWRHHKKDAKIASFFFAKCTQALAWLLFALRGGIPDWLSISLAYTLLFVGTSLEAIAMLMLVKAFDRGARKVYISLMALSIGGFHLLLLLYNTGAARIGFASLGIALFLVIPAYRLFKESNASLLMRMIGALYFLVFLSLTCRGVAALTSVNNMDIFTPGVAQTFSFLALYLVMILGNTGFVLLLKEQADQELIRMASLDELTGILNRRTFVARATQCLDMYAKKKKPITLLLFDVDHFKKINDTYGHNIGDQVLRHLVDTIKGVLGEGDLFGRYGGDEFAILFPGMDEAESSAVAEQIKRRTREAAAADLPVTFTLSMGLLTVVPDRHTRLDELYIACDKALYRAKENGRDGAARVWSENREALPS